MKTAYLKLISQLDLPFNTQLFCTIKSKISLLFINNNILMSYYQPQPYQAQPYQQQQYQQQPQQYQQGQQNYAYNTTTPTNPNYNTYNQQATQKQGYHVDKSQVAENCLYSCCISMAASVGATLCCNCLCNMMN